MVFLIRIDKTRELINCRVKREFLSVGIDIGTTTTQVIFSKITVESKITALVASEVKIAQTDIVYKSRVHFTPLLSREVIDMVSLKAIVSSEYQAAAVRKGAIATGAIIITGETARKENAEEVLRELAEFAGDFVVATAGPDLEGILAGCGAGARDQSKIFTDHVINFDIGGGTTNAAVFFDGEVIDSFALDIGGRLIQLDSGGRITYISDKLKSVISGLRLKLLVGEIPTVKQLRRLTDFLAAGLIAITENKPINPDIGSLFIHHRHKGLVPNYMMFSGGVAEFIYGNVSVTTLQEIRQFGDIGPLLGQSIRAAFEQYRSRFLLPKEKIRATAVGAGSHSVKISGSTIVCNEAVLPLKNIPIIQAGHAKSEIADICSAIRARSGLYKVTNAAIAFQGPACPTYDEIKELARVIIAVNAHSNEAIIVVVENDFAKALGQTINILTKNSKPVICLDKIKVDCGDYIDIGKPIGNVVPVIIKTMIFKN
ncbi:ethanolamine ammonia-lyase [Sporomusaceae bacterium FL31]|nr:ethanolamine ammonia-lyase [Sporomusaceae bacterium FL31]GCE32442.1 ethanolamine ammonia-lyase [Sporomusaceae bacterium]